MTVKTLDEKKSWNEDFEIELTERILGGDGHQRLQRFAGTLRVLGHYAELVVVTFLQFGNGARRSLDEAAHLLPHTALRIELLHSVIAVKEVCFRSDFFSIEIHFPNQPQIVRLFEYAAEKKIAQLRL